MSKTIAQIFGLTPPTVYTSGKATPLHNVPDPSLLYGLELEIERCSDDMVVKGMTVTTDGSLRNNGFEFITQPMTYSNLFLVLSSFFGKNKLTENNYSDRCSIHVHTNVLDLTTEQLRSLLMLYQVFEGVLFNFVGEGRDKNIFCVPWRDTQLSYQIVTDLAAERFYKIREWQKYTALNLRPIEAQGTVEWRHMTGTHDLKKILLWCRFIGHIYRMARGLSHEEVKNRVVQLNTTSLYDDLLSTVFQDDANELRRGDYVTALEDGVLNMKYSILQPYTGKKNTGKKSTWEAMYNEAMAQGFHTRGVIEPAPERLTRVNPMTMIFDDELPVQAAPPVELTIQEQLIRRAAERRRVDTRLDEALQRIQQARDNISNNQGGN